MPAAHARPASATVSASLLSGGAASRGLVILLGLAAVTVAVAGIRSIAGLVAPSFLALVIVIAVHPLRGWLARRHIAGWLATVAAILLAYAIVLALTATILVAAARLAALVPQYEDEARSIVDDIGSWLGNLGVQTSESSTLLSSLDLARVADLVTSLLSGLLGVLSNLFFLVTLLLFLTADAAWFPQRLAQARGTRAALVDAFDLFAHGTRTYLIVSTIFGLIVAVLDALLLWALGIPEPLVWGLLAFITNYVPNIGFVIGLIPPAVLALLEGGPALFLVVLVSYSLINVVIQTFIQPKVVGDTVGMATTVTFLSLAFWAWVLGPLGALLAIPLSLFVKALLVDVDADSRWLRPLISGGTAPPDAPVEGEAS